jgi:hypothetical protein
MIRDETILRQVLTGTCHNQIRTVKRVCSKIGGECCVSSAVNQTLEMSEKGQRRLSAFVY